MIEKLQSGAHDAVEVMNASQDRATETVDHANQAGDALKSIAGSVGRINDMNLQIASAAEQQSCTAEEINRNIETINDISNTTSETAEQTSLSSSDITDMASRLNRLVSQFRI